MKKYFLTILFSFLTFLIGQSTFAYTETFDKFVASGSGPNYTKSYTSANCEKSILIVNLQFTTGITLNSLTYNGVALTKLGGDYDLSSNNKRWSIWYLKNPAIGTKTLSYNMSGATGIASHIATFCDIDQTNPFQSTSLQAYNNISSAGNYVLTANITKNESKFLTFTSGNGTVVASNSGLTDLGIAGGTGWEYVRNYKTQTNINSSYQTTWNFSGSTGQTDIGYLVLNKAEPDYIFDGTSTEYNATTQELILGGDCTIPAGQTGVNQMAIQSVLASSTATTLDIDPAGAWRRNLFSCISNEVGYDSITGITTTSTVPVFGNFLAVYNGSSLTGIKKIVLDDSFYNHQYSPLDRLYLDWDFDTATSSAWLDGSTWVGPHDTSTTIGLASRLSACTEEEWNSEDPVFNWGFGTTALPIFNMTKVKCTILQAGYNIGYGFSDFIKTSVQSFINAIKNLFPFSVPLRFLESWTTSSAEDLPAELSWLGFDGNGNIAIELGNNEFTGNTTSSIIIFGSTITEGDSKSIIFYQRVRYLSTYVQWLLFIYWLYSFAVQIKSELKYGFQKTGNKELEYTPLDKDGWDGSMKV